MFINPRPAGLFITAYKRLLSEVHLLAGGTPLPDLLQTLARGREALHANPGLLNEAVAKLEERGERVNPKVRRALETMRFRQWVHLRDTSKYSIFLAPQEREAFGVVGLSGPVRDTLGGSGVTFQAGVVEYCGRYVCDGIYRNHTWLGPSYKRDFSSLFKALQAEGKFHTRSEL